MPFQKFNAVTVGTSDPSSDSESLRQAGFYHEIRTDYSDIIVFFRNNQTGNLINWMLDNDVDVEACFN